MQTAPSPPPPISGSIHFIRSNNTVLYLVSEISGNRILQSSHNNIVGQQSKNSVLVRAVLLLLDDERVLEYPVLGPQNQITPTTFLLKCPYQARNVSGHVYLCTGFNFVSYFDFSIVFWNCSASVIFFFILLLVIG